MLATGTVKQRQRSKLETTCKYWTKARRFTVDVDAFWPIWDCG